MSNLVVWVHGDCLNPEQEALRRHPGAPALWVWDDLLLRRGALSLKRILFIYECLLELPATIRRGEPVEELLAFARQHGVSTIATMHTISPGFGRIREALEAQGLDVVAYKGEPFVRLPEGADLRRFSRYWRVAQRALASES